MGLVLPLLLWIAYSFSNENIPLNLNVEKIKTLKEIREFKEMVKETLQEEYVEVAPSLKVLKKCKVERGIASWYGGRFHGRRTANGEIYDLFKFTAASRTLPLDTYVLVRNEENGRIITVRINDRGPYVDGRIIDLSQAAAYKLGMMWEGIAMVQVIPLKCIAPETLFKYYDEIILDIANTF